MVAQTTNPKFPGPSYNRIIDTDPQIVKVPMEGYQFGSRLGTKALPQGNHQAGDAAPSAPGTEGEMKIDHI